MKKRSSSQKNQKSTVKTKGTQERVTIGMDLGDKTSRYCMLSNEGEILREGQVTTTKAGMDHARRRSGRTAVRRFCVFFVRASGRRAQPRTKHGGGTDCSAVAGAVLYSSRIHGLARKRTGPDD